MLPLKIDRTKLMSVKKYSKKCGYTPQRIYQLADAGEITLIDVDGIKLVYYGK